MCCLHITLTLSCMHVLCLLPEPLLDGTVHSRKKHHILNESRMTSLYRTDMVLVEKELRQAGLERIY